MEDEVDDHEIELLVIGDRIAAPLHQPDVGKASVTIGDRSLARLDTGCLGTMEPCQGGEAIAVGRPNLEHVPRVQVVRRDHPQGRVLLGIGLLKRVVSHPLEIAVALSREDRAQLGASGGVSHDAANEELACG